MALACFATAPAFAQRAAALSSIPRLDEPVVDITGTLSMQGRQRLDARASELRQRSGAQLQILIVPTTAPEDVADYAQRVFDTQGLGRRGFDDGLLIVVAKDDRRMRVHVGTGLEAKIPDATAQRLIDEYLTPKFRRGDFAGGLDDAPSVLASLMNGEPLPAPRAQHRSSSAFSTLLILILVLMALLIALLLPLHLHRQIAAQRPDRARGPSDPGRQWNPDELTFDPNDPEAVRRRQERERREREAARDNDTDWAVAAPPAVRAAEAEAAAAAPRADGDVAAACARGRPPAQ
ncbi:MAG: TPM domain-containing protein [Lysobacter sp.]|nr:TPM domain-containing protein [Lysobacter sp.]